MEIYDSDMCAKCLNCEVDITERLPKHEDVVLCPVCGKYSQPPGTWLMTKQKLLKSCIRSLKKNLNNVQHVQAEFIQTEPDSNMIKVKLTVLLEVLGEILEKSYTVEYVVCEQMCANCSRVQAIPDQVQAIPDQLVVQLRQNVSHRRTFFHLEQLILKHGAAVGCIRIKQVPQGLDFIFPNEGHALKFVEFLATVVPVKSRDPCIYDGEYILFVEICRICPGDLIFLPREVAASLGDFGPLVICTKITDCIVLMNPFNLECHFLDGAKYWRFPFKSLLSSSELIEYVVVDIEYLSEEVMVCGSRYVLGEALLCREEDYWVNNTCFNELTHLGGVLCALDHAFGYDLTVVKSNNIELDRDYVLPDVVLVKRFYREELEYYKGKPRPWVLKRLDMEVDGEEMKIEFEEFLEEVETNPGIWSDYNFYKNKDYDPSVPSFADAMWGRLILSNWIGLPPFPEKLLLEEPVQVGKDFNVQ